MAPLVNFGNKQLPIKKLYGIVIVIFAFSTLHLNAQNADDLETFEKAINPGAELTYDVTVKGKQFKLIVTLKTVGDAVAYTWKTTGPDNKSGSVTMTANALATAQALVHIFASGDTKPDKETCLCVSNRY